MSSFDCRKSSQVPYPENRAVKCRQCVFSNYEQSRPVARYKFLKTNVEPMKWSPQSTFDCPLRVCEFELMSIPEKAVWVFLRHYEKRGKLSARLFFDMPQISLESTIRNKSEIRTSYR